MGSTLPEMELKQRELPYSQFGIGIFSNNNIGRRKLREM